MPRLELARAQWKKYRPKSTSEAGTGSPSKLQVLLDQMPAARADHDRGEPVVVAEPVLRAVGGREVDAALAASSRVSWPSTNVLHVGEVASSKSAIQTRAPEVSASTAVRRSGGPVISTRRSVRPGAGGATRQVGSARTGRWPRGSRTGSPTRTAAPGGGAP
ncbi:hypothetical protein SMD44_07993 [Streptomyces alboflavus]|uniref:Uncharacterized protein n=1 Tax=Streptomyces alboflavus TaxID=67267 RepID=A0A1Z1WQ09_9ACTN|nr:hypothetical protein SMD44_07993 [Streptomyces alboflavus]